MLTQLDRASSAMTDVFDDYLPEVVEAIKLGILATHTVDQVKPHYHWRKKGIHDSRFLDGQPNIRQSLSPEGQLDMSYDFGMSLLDTFLVKLYQAGREAGYNECLDEPIG